MDRKNITYQTEYEIVALVRMHLYQRSHGLAVLLGTMEVQVDSLDGEYRVDGRKIYLDAERLRRTFLGEWGSYAGQKIFSGDEGGCRILCQEFLHMLSHCLLGHIFLNPEKEKGRRKNRMDKAAEVQTYEELLDKEAWELAERLWGEPIERRGIVDSHTDWQRVRRQEQLARAAGDKGDSDCGSSEEERIKRSLENLEMWWKKQLESLQKDEGQRKKRKAGTAKRNRSQRLVTAAGHRGDYREILKSFSIFRENSCVNLDEFQYAWYEYGLQTYGNMPLIEPLEYREERKIEDLVLVIDTSGSCEKELVRVFLEETKGILEQEELFFRRFCLHILQCDNQIQRDDRITSQEDFEEYLENLTITGGGGTDFRPAFAHIAKLKQEGAFRELQGMLYFTDGVGLYPKEEPDYEVWFVMMKNHYDTIDTPDWIHCLVLEERAEA